MAWGIVVAASVEAGRAPARAAELLGAAEAAYARLGVAWDLLDLRLREEITNAVRDALGDAETAAAIDKGSRTPLDAAVGATLDAAAADSAP
jgi:hypothetical protein